MSLEAAAALLESKVYRKIQEAAPYRGHRRGEALRHGFCPDCGYDFIFDTGEHTCTRKEANNAT